MLDEPDKSLGRHGSFSRSLMESPVQSLSLTDDIPLTVESAQGSGSNVQFGERPTLETCRSSLSVSSNNLSFSRCSADRNWFTVSSIAQHAISIAVSSETTSIGSVSGRGSVGTNKRERAPKGEPESTRTHQRQNLPIPLQAERVSFQGARIPAQTRQLKVRYANTRMEKANRQPHVVFFGNLHGKRWLACYFGLDLYLSSLGRVKSVLNAMREGCTRLLDRPLEFPIRRLILLCLLP